MKSEDIAVEKLCNFILFCFQNFVAIILISFFIGVAFFYMHLVDGYKAGKRYEKEQSQVDPRWRYIDPKAQ